MANEVIDWLGGDCPVNSDVKVDIKRRDGGQCFGVRAGDVMDWSHHRRGRDSDIVAYRIHEAPPPL